MLRFAFVATLLMLLAPLVSRALQPPHHGQQGHAQQGSEGHVSLLQHGPHSEHAPHMRHGSHSEHAAHIQHASHQQHSQHSQYSQHIQHTQHTQHIQQGALETRAAAAAEVAPAPPADPHAQHGEACEYCLMASRLLPWLALCLVLLPLVWRPVPPSPQNLLHYSAPRWPAHAARGPPELSTVR